MPEHKLSDGELVGRGCFLGVLLLLLPIGIILALFEEFPFPCFLGIILAIGLYVHWLISNNSDDSKASTPTKNPLADRTIEHTHKDDE